MLQLVFRCSIFGVGCFMAQRSFQDILRHWLCGWAHKLKREKTMTQLGLSATIGPHATTSTSLSFGLRSGIAIALMTNRL